MENFEVVLFLGIELFWNFRGWDYPLGWGWEGELYLQGVTSYFMTHKLLKLA